MNNSVTADTFVPFLDWCNFDLTVPNAQDGELVKQLPFIPGLKEILMLRQVHALEHATVWVLSDRDRYGSISSISRSLATSPVDNELLSGLSTDQGFYLYGQVNKIDLQRAVRKALQRLISGEWNLAVHPRCGTNLSVEMLMTVGLAVGIHFLLPREPIEQMLGLGIAAIAAAQLSPELGMLAQRYITTAIPFNLEIVDIRVTQDSWGRTAHFVQVGWSE